MIFGMVGTHTAGFDRLVEALDRYAVGMRERVVIQIGSGKYVPQHAEWFRMAPPETMNELARQARVIVTHAGAGSLLGAMEHEASIVAVPRLKRYGEHIDDHQLELSEVLQQVGLVRSVSRLDQLPELLQGIKETPQVRTSDQLHRLRDELRRSSEELVAGRGSK